MRRFATVAIVGIASILGGCESEEETTAGDRAEDDPGGGATTVVSASSGAGLPVPDGEGGSGGGIDCANAPLVTWASFGDAFATRHCTGCHASTAIDRHGAPEGVDFDDRDTFLAYSMMILDMVARDAGDPPPDDLPAMPPGGGVDDDERTLLRTWLTCNVELETP